MIEKRMIVLEDLPPELVFRCAEKLLPFGFMAYEPESIRFEFADLGLDLPEINYEKLFAVQALIIQDNFFWDADVFAMTCSVFNGLPSMPERMPNLAPCVLAWGVEQAIAILNYQDPGVIPEELALIDVFDDDPEMYTAMCCVEHSLFVPPSELGFAREALKHITPVSESLVTAVKSAWADLPQSALSSCALSESAQHVQLAQMCAVRLYCDEQRALLDAARRHLV